jgi:hypothetical protein
MSTLSPKVLGVEMAPRYGRREYFCEFGRLEVSVTLWGSEKYSAFLDATCVEHAAPMSACIAAIERELLAIRAAIPSRGKSKATPKEHQ